VWHILTAPSLPHTEKHINLFMAVPTIYAKLIEYYENKLIKSRVSITSEFIYATLSNKIRIMVSGSSALPQPISDQWEKITGHRLLERYGMSEIGMALSCPLNGTRVTGSVGNPMPNIKVRIVKPNVYSPSGYDILVEGNSHHTIVHKENEPGDLQVQGPSVFLEYWKKPVETAEAFTKDGWFKTGDTVKYHQSVYYIVGRTSVDVIKSGGYKISALEIERHLLAHPEIKDCAVVGLPDLTWGQKVAAILVSKSGRESLDLASLKQWASSYLPPYQLPTVIKWIESIPKNTLGKYRFGIFVSWTFWIRPVSALGLLASNNMALTLTENFIRNRVNLTHENLEDIKSLSLPGTFHEKIVSIGTSLRKFSRLKSVDFSRNALGSLQGLEHLQLLEKLNLLEELQRLKHNQNLKEIDLRLNPVTRNEPDYRLYLIHMLPNLQKLDDRGVSDRERQAALTHFSSSQASEMVGYSAIKQTVANKPLPRTEMVSKLIKGPSDDDTAVIDIMNRNEGDFGKPRPLTGSNAKEDNATDYTLESLKTLDQPKQSRLKDKLMENAESNDRATINKCDAEKVDPRLIRYKEMYPNILAAPSENIQRISEGHRDNNLIFSDEEEASLKYKGQGYFTPHPEGKYEHDMVNNHSLAPAKGDRRSRVESISQDDFVKRNKPRHQRTQSLPGLEFMSDPDQAKEKNLLFSLLNLVDRYWNGTKSLHKHPKFIEQSLQFISEYTLTQVNKEDEVKILRQKIEKLNEENTLLKRKQDSHHSDIDANLVLKRAKEDMERMHEEIRHYMNENRELQRRLDGWESGANPAQYSGGAAASDTTMVNLSVLDNLQRKNNALAKEVEQMKMKINQCDELTSMLQESHRSLIETNAHLLRELEINKHKHQKEIEQMHWSYEQLKSTISQTSMIQPSPRNELGSNNNTSSFSRGKNDILIV
ncbi:Acyl-CoA synthetase member 3, mitochondrial, partial [Bulinus truncatus]